MTTMPVRAQCIHGTAIVCGLLSSALACAPADRLTPLPIAEAESALDAPTGELEATDTLSLAYMIFGTHHVLDVISVSSSKLPGVDRSSLFEHADIEACARDSGRGVEVNYPCLGHASGILRIVAAGRFASLNGEYDLSVESASIGHGVSVAGSVAMRVQGVANPTKPEKIFLVPTAIIDGLPERFEAVHETAMIIDNSDGEKLAFASRILGETFAWTRQPSDLESEIVYTVRDKRNFWDCTSRIEQRQITQSECRTPIGQGDFAALRF